MLEEKREIRLHPYNPIASIIIPHLGSRDPRTTNEKGIESYTKDGSTVLVTSPHDPLFRVEQHPILEGVGLYDRGYAFGAEENLTLDKFSPQGLELLLEAIISRSKALRDVQVDGRRLRQFHAYATYENDGLVGKLLPSERIAPLIADEIKKALEYYGRRQICMYCNIICQEQDESINEESRLVFLDEDRNGYIGFVPFSSQHPCAVSIFPLKHISRLTEFLDWQVKQLALWIYKSINAVSKLTDQKINLFLYSTPFFSDKGDEFNGDVEKSHHFHAEITPDGNQIPGTGWYVIPSRPKDVARTLRRLIKI